MLEPKTRGVEPEVLMETLFRATALETPVSAEHERADGRPHARWCWACAACCAPGSTTGTRCWCAARGTGWRRSSGGWRCWTATSRSILNLDEVIRIIREEDEPKPALIAAFHADRRAGRGDPQHAPALAAPARGDGDPQGAQGADRGGARRSTALLKDERLRWARIAGELEETREKFGAGPLGDAAHACWATCRPRSRSNAEQPDRARADHRDPVREGLDPRGARASGRRRRS